MTIVTCHHAAPCRTSPSILDEALFRSKLAGLKTCLEGERKYWTETHDEIEEPESEDIANELVELARRPIDERPVKEFEACLTEADKSTQTFRRAGSSDGSNNTTESQHSAPNSELLRVADPSLAYRHPTTPFKVPGTR